MEIKRDIYLDRLISKKHSGLIKVITGISGCGKSYLLFNLFKNHLISSGIRNDHIIEMSFDLYENLKYQDPEVFFPYVKNQIKDDDMYYVLLDEVQLLDKFEFVLNSFSRISNMDIYVTGSNAKFLSKDIITEFRGRGDEIHMYPLSFGEFMSVYPKDINSGWTEYQIYGGLPLIFKFDTEAEKKKFLKTIFQETYLSDIIARHKIRNRIELEELLNILSSNIGSLTNPQKISDTFKSIKKKTISSNTLKKYMEYLEDSFLIDSASRYDIKGRRYIQTPLKYYFTDLGLRNARINFRQVEKIHILENVIFNELKLRGYSVDVGVIASSSTSTNNGKFTSVQREVDFVCNSASKRYYIQSAYSMKTETKKLQEKKSLLMIHDGFKKIIITSDAISSYYSEEGILMMNVFDFLLNKDSLDI